MAANICIRIQTQASKCFSPMRDEISIWWISTNTKRGENHSQKYWLLSKCSGKEYHMARSIIPDGMAIDRIQLTYVELPLYWSRPLRSTASTGLQYLYMKLFWGLFAPCSHCMCIWWFAHRCSNIQVHSCNIPCVVLFFVFVCFFLYGSVVGQDFRVVRWAYILHISCVIKWRFGGKSLHPDADYVYAFT